MELKYCPRDRDFSDAGNALTFSELHKADIAFNKAFDWTVWDGVVWEPSEEKATLAADKFTAAMRDEAKENFISAQGAVVRLEVADEKDGEALKKAKGKADAAKKYFSLCTVKPERAANPGNFEAVERAACGSR